MTLSMLFWDICSWHWTGICPQRCKNNGKNLKVENCSRSTKVMPNYVPSSHILVQSVKEIFQSNFYRYWSGVFIVDFKYFLPTFVLILNLFLSFMKHDGVALLKAHFSFNIISSVTCWGECYCAWHHLTRGLPFLFPWSLSMYSVFLLNGPFTLGLFNAVDVSRCQ